MKEKDPNKKRYPSREGLKQAQADFKKLIEDVKEKFRKALNSKAPR